MHPVMTTDDPDPLWTAELRRTQQALPPAGCFTGLTAARLRGWWLPPLPEDVPIFVAVPETAPHPERAGLVVTRHAVAPAYEEVDGLRVATPGETLLGCWDLNLLDLVVLLDGALARGAGLSGIRAVARRRRRGAPLLRRAVEVADDRSQSPWETVLRMFHVTVGVPVEPQWPVVVDDEVVAHADLWIVGTRTLQEYDGAVHRDPRQHRIDMRRQRALTRGEWWSNAYTSTDLLHRGVAVLRDADHALGRAHDPRRLDGWNALLQGSLFTPAGTALARRRWERAALGRSARRRQLRAERSADAAPAGRGGDDPCTEEVSLGDDPAAA